MILSYRQKVHINAFKDLLKLLKHLKNYHQPNLKSDTFYPRHHSLLILSFGIFYSKIKVRRMSKE